MTKKLTRQELEQWARTLDEENAPYSSQIQAENSFFVNQLTTRPGDTYEDIRTEAEKDFTEKKVEAKKWKNASWGSLGVGIGVNLVTGGAVGLAALVGGFAGMLYSSSRASKDEIQGHEGEHFVVQLDDVAKDLEKKTS
ncbi:MAG: hypothetical protein HQL46_00780 [Gammaproteobacteria bacterium]|nr:hypothetical protein [Gammaproteobacteria bacterium]